MVSPMPPARKGERVPSADGDRPVGEGERNELKTSRPCPTGPAPLGEGF